MKDKEKEFEIKALLMMILQANSIANIKVDDGTLVNQLERKTAINYAVVTLAKALGFDYKYFCENLTNHSSDVSESAADLLGRVVMFNREEERKENK